MTFNSLAFVIFFCVVTPTYFLLPHRFRWVLLVVASCYFYMYWNVWLIWIILGTVTVDYFAALGMERTESAHTRKLLLVASLVSNIGVLAVFKYTNFLVASINDGLSAAGLTSHLPLWHLILPIGISFHTFQAMSYTIDVHRKVLPTEHNYGRYLLYVLFYPQLVSGPIERARNFLPQLHDEHRFEYRRVVDGLQMMLWGFFKKSVVADTLAEYVNAVYNHPATYPGFALVLGTWFFAFQIYCDFSGYTDIAIGAAKVMGFTLMKNFNRPYVAASVGEFWHRWHISLSTWFRDYLYLPLGGSRCSPVRQAFNIMVVFMVSGLWHGANWTYVVWGALHGFYLLLERAVTLPFTVPRWLRVIVTFNLVCIGWVFFRATSIHDAVYILSHLSFAEKLTPISGGLTNFMILLILMLLWMESRMRDDQVHVYLQSRRPAVRWVWAASVLAALFLMYPEAPSTFIYFQF